MKFYVTGKSMEGGRVHMELLPNLLKESIKQQTKS